MDPLKLTFQDVHAEREYERRVTLGLKKFDVSIYWWPLRMMLVVRWLFHSNQSWSFLMLLSSVVLSLMPLGMYVIQVISSETWFLKNGRNLRVAQGMFQVLLRGALIRTHFQEASELCVADLVVAAGVPVVLDNLFWFHSGFKVYAISSIFAAATWHALILNPFCLSFRKHSGDLPSSLLRLLHVLHESLDLFTGSSFDIELNTDMCYQSFSFVHFYICVSLASCLIWCLEKRSRLGYIALQQSEQFRISSRLMKFGNREFEICRLLLLSSPLLWQAIALSQHIASFNHFPHT